MTLPTNSELNVATEQVFDLANQLSNGDSQPPQQEPNPDQRIPYDRFKEVNDERKALQDQNNKLMELMQNFQQMQTNANVQAQQAIPAQPVPTHQPLFSDDELNSFEQDIVLDPKSTLQKFGEAILKRGVESRVQALEQSFEQKLAQLTGQVTAQTIPSVIANFKQNRFNGQSDAAEIAAFDQALQGIDPALLANPATLENVRLAAIGYVADQRRSQPQSNPQHFFTETPGGQGLPGGWGGLNGGQQQPQIPPQVIEAARKMGIDPKEAAAMYQAMNTSGVFRG